MIVFDAANGQPVALLDGTSITTARTAAGSALATDLLHLARFKLKLNSTASTDV